MVLLVSMSTKSYWTQLQLQTSLSQRGLVQERIHPFWSPFLPSFLSRMRELNSGVQELCWSLDFFISAPCWQSPTSHYLSLRELCGMTPVFRVVGVQAGRSASQRQSALRSCSKPVDSFRRGVAGVSHTDIVLTRRQPRQTCPSGRQRKWWRTHVWYKCLLCSRAIQLTIQQSGVYFTQINTTRSLHLPMANAHLPNSHPDVTPGWQPTSPPPVKFLEAINTIPVQGFNGCRFSGFVPAFWCSNGKNDVFAVRTLAFTEINQASQLAGRMLAAHGGFCAATLLGAAQNYFMAKQESNVRPAPSHLHIEYLCPMPQGPFHIVVKPMHAGNRSVSLQAELISPHTEQAILYATALIRLGYQQDGRRSDEIQPPIPRLPDRVAECDRWSSAFCYAVNPPISSVRFFCPNDGSTLFWSPSFGGQHARDQWAKLDDGGMFQVEHIPLLVDLVWNWNIEFTHT